jgi:FtsH-binding integral membrane protein
LWAYTFYISVACGLLLKGLVAAVFPVIIAGIYFFVRGKAEWAVCRRRLHPWTGIAIVLLIAAPWHILATIRNPPYFDWTMHSSPGEYHGFFWFYFFNEHLFRFLNMRYPRDYNTVPRVWFWLFHFAWLFPWSATMVLAFRRRAEGSRGQRTHTLALVWILFILIFFTLSTTQEYYSLPIYPALAMLIGAQLASREQYPRWARMVLGGIFFAAVAVIGFLLFRTAHQPTPGDISTALTQNPDMYTLSLGHMSDLTVKAFAYLRVPLVLAGVGCLIGLVGMFFARKTMAAVAVLAAMMLVFIQAARLALITFDPYLSSYKLAEALEHAPPGQFIEGDAYYAFSATFFYTNRTALLWNGRSANLEYGSYAPGAKQIFINDDDLKRHWFSPERTYLLTYGDDLPHLKQLLGSHIHTVATSGGNYLLTNN